MKIFEEDSKANNILSLFLLLIGLTALITRIFSYFQDWNESFHELNSNIIYAVIGLSLIFNPWLSTKYPTRYGLIRLCGLAVFILTFYRPATALTILMIICVILPFVIRSAEKGFLGRVRKIILAKN